MKAVWHGATIAEADSTVVVEGNHYFHAESVDQRFLVDSATHSTCPWKREASYKTPSVDGEQNADAAWFYPAPKDAAANIKHHYAFCKGVEVTES